MTYKKILIVLSLLLFFTSTVMAQSRYIIKGVPHIRQEPYLCGAASCAMVLNYYRYKVSQQEIAECDIKNIEKQVGIDPEKMMSYLRSQGLRAELLYGDIRELQRFIEQDMPVVVSTWADLTKGNLHYRVIIGFDKEKGTIIFIDPGDGREYEAGNDLFLQLWNTSGSKPANKNLLIVVYP